MASLDDRETLDRLSVQRGFAPGTLLAGKYLVERELGAGGVGVVALATHVELRQRVAIKYLRAGTRTSPTMIERFKREARMAASLRSEHVVKVHDVGSLEDGTPYMVMEYLQGEDLASVLAKGGRAAIDQAVVWMTEACQALEEAHELGIVHRDLKPANLFLAKRPSGPPIVKIVDFGISKVAANNTIDGGIPAMTKQNEIFGTPYYMSPEQLVSSANVDTRSDVWALGVCLYELLTGRLPFEGTDLRQLVSDVLSSVARPIRDHRPEIPIELAQIVHACLQYDPAQRPASVANLGLRLTPFASKRYVEALALAETSDLSSADISGVHDLGWAPESQPWPSRGSAPEPRSSIALFALVGGASLLAGAALAISVAFLRPGPAQHLVGAEARDTEVVVAAPIPSAERFIELVELVPVVADAAPPVKPAITPKPVRSAAPTAEFGGRQ